MRNNVEFLHTYIHQTPLTGDAFASDADEVHMYIIKFISENATAENKILPYVALKDCCHNYKSLKDHYEGAGATAKAIVSSETDIHDMFYTKETTYEVPMTMTNEIAFAHYHNVVNCKFLPCMDGKKTQLISMLLGTSTATHPFALLHTTTAVG